MQENDRKYNKRIYLCMQSIVNIYAYNSRQLNLDMEKLIKSK